jgi:hypothetical protein
LRHGDAVLPGNIQHGGNAQRSLQMAVKLNLWKDEKDIQGGSCCIRAHKNLSVSKYFEILANHNYSYLLCLRRFFLVLAGLAAALLT